MTAASQQNDHRDLTAGPIRVVVVEADPLVRGSLRAVIGDSDDLQLVCEAAECGEIASQLTSAGPEVLVVDLGVLGDGRIGTLRQLRERLPGLQVVILAADDDPGSAVTVLDGSVVGLVLKAGVEHDLASAVRHAARGEQYLSPALSEGLAGLYEAATNGELSVRETEILRLIVLGHTSVEIARKLRLSPRTIETHRARIHRRLGLETRAELVRYALARGLLVV
ncbi:MAG: LuxR C-terminal-related transcriptional regulator [Solirubrobacteraceae bacterium]